MPYPVLFSLYYLPVSLSLLFILTSFIAYKGYHISTEEIYMNKLLHEQPKIAKVYLTEPPIPPIQQVKDCTTSQHKQPTYLQQQNPVYSIRIYCSKIILAIYYVYPVCVYMYGPRLSSLYTPYNRLSLSRYHPFHPYHPYHPYNSPCFTLI